MSVLRVRIEEAAELLRCSPAQIEVILRSGELQCHQDQPGGYRYISARALQDYIARREQAGVVPRRSA